MGALIEENLHDWKMSSNLQGSSLYSLLHFPHGRFKDGGRTPRSARRDYPGQRYAGKAGVIWYEAERAPSRPDRRDAEETRATEGEQE
jgi:hypothetical protein